MKLKQTVTRAMTKYLIVAASCLSFSFAWALPVPAPVPAGEYEYNIIAAENLQTKDHRVIFASTAAGKKELQQLQDKGYLCRSLPRNFYDCSQSTMVDDSAWIQRRLTAAYSQCLIQFFEPSGSPELISAGDSLQTWSLSQEVSVCGKKYSSYRIVLGPGINKVFVGEPAEITLNINLNSSAQQILWEPVLMQHDLSRFQFYRHFVRLPLNLKTRSQN